MKIEYLADNESSLPIIANWYCAEWGRFTREKEIEQLKKYLNKSKIPLILLAVDNGEPMGVAQIKYHEMSIYPEKTYWLGGIYVAKAHRGKGIGKKLVIEATVIAKKLNIMTLYLQTEDLSGGLYRQLGWRPIEQVNYHGVDVLVMERKTKDE